MTLSVYEAFTSKTIPTLGNPAAVKLFNGGMLSETEMSRIAQEASQPMTAFLYPRSEDLRDIDTRYYDLVGNSCHICGHATIAAMGYLRDYFNITSGEVRFHLDAARQNDKQERAIIGRFTSEDEVEIDLPQGNLVEVKNPEFYKELAAYLRVPTSDLVHAFYSEAIGDYVVEVATAEILLSIKPDFEGLKRMADASTSNFPHEGMMLTSQAPKGSGFDILDRVFLPITGVNEDIACGSGNCSIVPYWYQKGLNAETAQYKALFPYPVAEAKGVVGGVQTINYKPEAGIISLGGGVRKRTLAFA